MASFTPFIKGKKPSRPQGCRSALVIVDVQNDFVMETGSAAVPDAVSAIATINLLRHKVGWDLVAVTQDWHPEGHVSFLASHLESGVDAKHFDTIETAEGKAQTVWPVHCLQNSPGAEIHAELLREPSDLNIQKGAQKDVDAYSAFMDADRMTKTPLSKALAAANVTDVYLCGMSLEDAVACTAMDSVLAGFKTWVVSDCSPARNSERAKQKTIDMEKVGVTMVHSSVMFEEREDRRQAAADYMEEHNINLIFQKLCTGLVFHRPEDPKNFLVKEIQKMQKTRKGQLSRLTLLTDEDLETMFNLLDPIGKGILPASQVLKAMKGLQLTPSSKVSPDDTFNVTKFKQLLLAAK